MISLCGHTLMLGLFLLISFLSVVSCASLLLGNGNSGRSKRNVGQLVSLVVKDTPYQFTKLANYGNWCGKGGDLMGDGTVIDGCDACCKYHDKCYHKTRHTYPGCNPILTIYSYQHGQTNPTVSNELLLNSEELRQVRRNLSLPSCNTEENDGPHSCPEATCQCKLIINLRCITCRIRNQETTTNHFNYLIIYSPHLLRSQVTLSSSFVSKSNPAVLRK